MKKLFASLILLCVMLVAKGAESDVNAACEACGSHRKRYEFAI